MILKTHYATINHYRFLANVKRRATLTHTHTHAVNRADEEKPTATTKIPMSDKTSIHQIEYGIVSEMESQLSADVF